MLPVSEHNTLRKGFCIHSETSDSLQSGNKLDGLFWLYFKSSAVSHSCSYFSPCFFSYLDTWDSLIFIGSLYIYIYKSLFLPTGLPVRKFPQIFFNNLKQWMNQKIRNTFFLLDCPNGGIFGRLWGDLLVMLKHKSADCSCLWNVAK